MVKDTNRSCEKDDKIDSLTKQIKEWQRKAEQGSQEAQGEAMEGALLDKLRQAFPFDRFEGVLSARVHEMICFRGYLPS